ncbi:MAG: MBL fold metallo-hydrolase [Gemmatimonadota bacterium]
MKVASLGSGSRGNSVFVESDGTALLVDAGFSGAGLERRLDGLGIAPARIRGVVVTHEHRDHAEGIGVAARRWGWPLFLTAGTASACASLLRGSEAVTVIEPERRFRLGEAIVHPVRTCHDAADPVAVVVEEPSTGLRTAVATDLGRATTPVRSALSGCHFLVLEANHDEGRLRASPYPWSVKQRIGGSRGHLSNRLAAELAAELAHPDLGGLLLAHLSEECNETALARAVVEAGLRGTSFRGRLLVAEPAGPSEVHDVGGLVDRARGVRQLSLLP